MIGVARSGDRPHRRVRLPHRVRSQWPSWSSRARGVDIRPSGDSNPGYWNAKESLGRRAALPVFVGDVAKGSAAAAIGVIVGGPWWVGYVGGAAAMIGHAWPVFAGFRGGRSVLTFVGAMIVLAPVPAAIAAAVCIVVSVVSRELRARCPGRGVRLPADPGLVRAESEGGGHGRARWPSSGSGSRWVREHARRARHQLG